MAKYKNIKELAEAFKLGELKGWTLMVDNDSTHLGWRGDWPKHIKEDTDEAADFEDEKYDEGQELWDGSQKPYILDEALEAAGIPNEGV
jgi:hypothetical protein